MLVQIQTDGGARGFIFVSFMYSCTYLTIWLFILYVMVILILPYNFSLGWEWEPDFKTLFWGMNKLQGKFSL